jgi:hypothetical protein
MVDDEILMRRPEPLALPFAMLGAVTCLFLFDLEDTLAYVVDTSCVLPGVSWRVSVPDWDERFMAALLGSIAYACAGRWTSSRISDGARPWTTAVTACVAATQIPSALVGLFSFGALWGRLMLMGVVGAALSAPCAILMAKSVYQAGRSRPDSLLLTAYRRTVWLDVSIFSVVMCALYANPVFGVAWHAGDDRREAAQFIVVMAIVVGSIAGGAGWLSLVKLTRLRRGCTTNDEPLVDDTAAVVLDLGMGNQVERELRGRASAYRTLRQTRTLLKGDVARAVRTLRWALARASTVVTIGAAVLLIDLPPSGVLNHVWRSFC